jgi:hypothetical protein
MVTTRKIFPDPPKCGPAVEPLGLDRPADDDVTKSALPREPSHFSLYQRVADQEKTSHDRPSEISWTQSIQDLVGDWQAIFPDDSSPQSPNR